ncbi:MAG: N-acetyltransferase [Candidatus Goldbacteria bacterium]|nr:N-acetyltransferase [Candidatus Goldiibacteriota bacterium]
MAKVRFAKVNDAIFIHKIIKKYALEFDLIPRSIADIYTQIRDFYILEENKKRIGVIGLHIYWDDLGEIRSFIIEKNYRNKGYGTKLLDFAIKEAKKIGLKSVFVLTKIPDFFVKYGFKKIPKKNLPQKIWKDCFNCPKFPDCDEHSLIYYFKNKREK